MYQTISLSSGVTLRCMQSSRFKHAVLSIQFLRPMCREEAAKNALISEVLLRGCESAPNLRQITARLDDLYGASLGALIRRVGDNQLVGLSCSFIDDRFAMPGDEIFRPMVALLEDILLHPLTEGDGFQSDFVRSEKKNLIAALKAQRNDKQAYASAKLIQRMCGGDSFAVPRLGKISDLRAVTPQSAYDHYRKILTQSPMEIFYVGSARPQRVADLLRPMLERMERHPAALPAAVPFRPAKKSNRSEKMDITQGKLAMGFVTPVTYADSRFAAMQLLNGIFGAGATSKLFVNVREKKSLCYAIGSGYYGAKGILTVSAGIDTERLDEVKAEILHQLELCRRGEITQEELTAAKEAVLSSLRCVYDSPGAMESFFSTCAVSGLNRSPEVYADEIRQVRLADVVAAANTLEFHSSFFLKGAEDE